MIRTNIRINIWVKNIRIFKYSNIFDPNIYSDICSYHFSDTNIFVRVNFLGTNIFAYSFVARFWYEYIRIFVRIIFFIRIYSDIHWYCFLDMNMYSNIRLYRKFIFATPWFQHFLSARTTGRTSTTWCTTARSSFCPSSPLSSPTQGSTFFSPGVSLDQISLGLSLILLCSGGVEDFCLEMTWHTTAPQGCQSQSLATSAFTLIFPLSIHYEMAHNCSTEMSTWVTFCFINFFTISTARLLLAPQDAFEVMFGNQPVSEWHYVSRLYWCDSGVWGNWWSCWLWWPWVGMHPLGPQDFPQM